MRGYDRAQDAADPALVDEAVGAAATATDVVVVLGLPDADTEGTDRTGIDLPSETRGRVGGRAFKTALNEQLHDAWCQRAVSGYPEVAKTDPNRAAFLKALAKGGRADDS